MTGEAELIWEAELGSWSHAREAELERAYRALEDEIAPVLARRAVEVVERREAKPGRTVGLLAHLTCFVPDALAGLRPACPCPRRCRRRRRRSTHRAWRACRRSRPVGHARLREVAGELVGDVLTHDQPAVALRIGEAGAELLCGLELLGGEARITGGVKGNANVAWRS